MRCGECSGSGACDACDGYGTYPDSSPNAGDGPECEICEMTGGRTYTNVNKHIAKDRARIRLKRLHQSAGAHRASERGRGEVGQIAPSKLFIDKMSHRPGQLGLVAMRAT